MEITTELIEQLRKAPTKRVKGFLFKQDTKYKSLTININKKYRHKESLLKRHEQYFRITIQLFKEFGLYIEINAQDIDNVNWNIVSLLNFYDAKRSNFAYDCITLSSIIYIFENGDEGIFKRLERHGKISSLINGMNKSYYQEYWRSLHKLPF